MLKPQDLVHPLVVAHDAKVRSTTLRLDKDYEAVRYQRDVRLCCDNLSHRARFGTGIYESGERLPPCSVVASPR